MYIAEIADCIIPLAQTSLRFKLLKKLANFRVRS